MTDPDAAASIEKLTRIAHELRLRDLDMAAASVDEAAKIIGTQAGTIEHLKSEIEQKERSIKRLRRPYSYY